MISQNVNGATSYFIYDGLGSTKALTDSNGSITDTYQYDAYGEITAKTGNTDNIYLYTGEQFDRSLNQYYLRARYYNQGVGRFTQMDSWQGRASNPTTLNKYLYADANPVMNIDPTGNFSLGGMMSGLNGMTSLMSSAGRYGTIAVNTYDKVDRLISLIQMTRGVHSAISQMNSFIGQSGNTQPKGFVDALKNLDEASIVLAGQFSWLSAEMMQPNMKDKIGQFLKNPKNKFLIYGPTPYPSNSPWLKAGTRVHIGKLSLSKGSRDIELELGKSSSQGGRLTGVGHSNGASKNNQGRQWWRMDWHKPHGGDSNDKVVGNYHFHTRTVK